MGRSSCPRTGDSNLQLGCLGIDVRRELGIDAQAGRQGLQERLLLARMGLDRDARGRVDLQRHLGLGAGARDQVLDRGGVGDLVTQELRRLGAQTHLVEATEDLLLFGLIDLTVGGGRRDHGPHVEQRMIAGLCLRLEAGTAGRGRVQRLARCHRGLALRVVLIGLVGEAADQHETAELGRVDGKATSGLRADDETTERADHGTGAELVVGQHLLELLDRFLRALPARHLPQEIVDLLAGADGFVDPARAFAGALLGLSEDLAEHVAHATQAAAGGPALPGLSSSGLAEDLRENVTNATTGPAGLRWRVLALLLTAALTELAQDIGEAAAGIWRGRLRRSGFRATSHDRVEKNLGIKHRKAPLSRARRPHAGGLAPCSYHNRSRPAAGSQLLWSLAALASGELASHGARHGAGTGGMQSTDARASR